MTTIRPNDTLTAVPGFRVGHFTQLEGGTGCTVILCPPDTVGAVDVRGGAPGTRETDLLDPARHVTQVHAVMLAGGSAYGLAAADGAMRYLEEQGIGYPAQNGFVVPIVPAAIVFDLPVGQAGVRPDAAMGYAACQAASAEPVAEGTVGAGTGCRIGAMFGNAQATKGGIGSASMDAGGGVVVAALVVVNAVGDVLDEQGAIIAGLRQSPDSDAFVGMLNALRAFSANTEAPATRDNTVIGVVATNARLTKAEAAKVAQMAHDGLARAINPAHTMHDGDTIFALASGQQPANVSLVGAFAAEAVAAAVRRAVRAATTLGDVRAANG
jgi:L-aminopeptidase/D-esterase-like protein